MEESRKEYEHFVPIVLIQGQKMVCLKWLANYEETKFVSHLYFERQSKFLHFRI